MVFTIVTVIFLPMSFIAAVFAIPLNNFETANGAPSLPFSYVAKFIFGVGLAISIPLITIAFAVDSIKGIFRNLIKVLFPGKGYKRRRESLTTSIDGTESMNERLLEQRSVKRKSQEIAHIAPAPFLQAKNIRHRTERGWREKSDATDRATMDLERGINGM